MTNVIQNNQKSPEKYLLNRQEEDETDIGELIAPIIEGRYLIIGVSLIVLSLGMIYGRLAMPIYKADGIIQIEDQTPKLDLLESVQPLLGDKSQALTEIEIIKSRRVLGGAVKNLNLDIMLQPKFFPVIGAAIARHFANTQEKGQVSAPLFGLASYAWGGEELNVDSFIVPDKYMNKMITLITGENGHFKLNVDNELLAEGDVGKPLVKRFDHGQGDLSLFVSLLNARAGTEFSIARLSLPKAIALMRSNLTVAEVGKGTGILNFTLESPDANLAAKSLNELMNLYIKQNVEQKSKEAQNTLEFLDKQLPDVKSQLDQATDALNDYRIRKGSIDLEEESKNVLQGVVETKTQLVILQEKRDELRQNYTESHPRVIALDKHIARLQAQINAMDKQIETLPETQQVIVRLSRDAEVNTQLYTTLLNNSQTLKVAKAGTVGNARIIDDAVIPTEIEKPKKQMIMTLSFVIGLMIGLVIVFIRKALHRGIEDPDLIERHLNIPIYATIPHSEEQATISQKIKNNKLNEAQGGILAIINKDDMAIESLRSLRTTLHFAFLEAHNNIIMITGPSPGVGKSFISLNLSVVLADSGKKILLIDADLRKGVLHNALNISRENGLSDLITDRITLEQALYHIPNTNIDMITTGSIPPNPSELLMHERFENLLETLSKEYDHVIVDSPPILAVTDSGIIGRIASATLMVVKAGRHSMGELDQCAKRLGQSGVNIKGIVFNDMSPRSSRYGYGYGYGSYGYGGRKYVYRYNYDKAKE